MMPHILMDPQTCFNDANQQDVIRCWEHLPAVMRQVLAVSPPAVIMPGI